MQSAPAVSFDAFGQPPLPHPGIAVGKTQFRSGNFFGSPLLSGSSLPVACHPDDRTRRPKDRGFVEAIDTQQVPGCGGWTCQTTYNLGRQLNLIRSQ